MSIAKEKMSTATLMRSVANHAIAYGTAGSVLVLGAIFLILHSMGLHSVGAQNPTVTLPKLVLEPGHTEYVSTQNPNTPDIINVKSSNQSVTANVYRVNFVQITAVAQGGPTLVEFFDNSQRIQYQLQVWVEKGGAGAGYDPTKTQINQVVMLVNHTQNLTVPGGGNHQLSSFASSHPSVATARMDNRNTIQIYSAALGDTFINFTDNATGTTYQVHVWVVTSLSVPIQGNDKPPNRHTGPGPGPGPNPTPPINPKGPGSIDPCLVGTWEATSVVTPDVSGGGTGFRVIFKNDGTETVDYSTMQPFQISNDETTYTGSATARISTANKTARVESMERTGVSLVGSKLAGNAIPIIKLPGLGFGGLGDTSGDNSYSCTKDTLEYQGSRRRDRRPNVSIELTRMKK